MNINSMVNRILESGKIRIEKVHGKTDLDVIFITPYRMDSFNQTDLLNIAHTILRSEKYYNLISQNLDIDKYTYKYVQTYRDRLALTYVKDTQENKVQRGILLYKTLGISVLKSIGVNNVSIVDESVSFFYEANCYCITNLDNLNVKFEKYKLSYEVVDSTKLEKFSLTNTYYLLFNEHIGKQIIAYLEGE